MNRTLSVERIFSLGDYQNLRVNNTLTDIPEEVVSNPDDERLLRDLQLLDVELTWLRYAQIKLSYPKITTDEAVNTALETIEEQRRLTFEKLSELLKTKGE
jgi:hypothetical protein